MSSTMSHHASARGVFGDEITLYNFSDENSDPTDAPDWTRDAGVLIEGHIDWKTTDDVVETVAGEEVRADADAFIPEEYDVRDGRRSGERASVIEDGEGNEFRVEHAYVEAGVYVCTLNMRETFVNE
jgi:hypothetical protein